MALTKLENLVDPQVMADMISAQLPKQIKFSRVAPVDTTLQGQPGSTITVPRYKYIGDAKEVAEGVAIDYTKLETSTGQHQIKKCAIGVELTDEAVLSGYGDPLGEAVKQLTMSIGSKVDNDIVDIAKTTPLKVKTAVGIDMIDKIEDIFDDEDDSRGVLFLNNKDASKLRKEAGDNWTRASDLGDDILVKGAFGECLGWEIVRTKRLDQGNALAIKEGALKTYLKRSALVENARDIDRKITKVNADQHYVVGLFNDTKVVEVQPEGA